MRALLLCALLVVAAGCGGAAAHKPPPASPDERAIRATLDRYAAAVRAGDLQARCALTAQELLDRIKALGTTCPEAFAGEMIESGRRFTLTVTAVKIAGDRALAHARTVERGRPHETDADLVREHGRWLITLETP